MPSAVTFDALRSWLAHLRPGLDDALAAWQSGLSAASALAAARSALAGSDCCPSFVPQAALPVGQAYEAFIHRSRQLSTHDKLHAFFNDVAWLAMPALNWRLNPLRVTEIAQRGVAAVRGPVRDALTLFDASGALLQGQPPLLQALGDRDWPTPFITIGRVGPRRG